MSKIPLTIVTYGKSGFTKENPRIDNIEVEAETEFQARKKAFNQARDDGWWIIWIEVGGKV